MYKAYDALTLTIILIVIFIVLVVDLWLYSKDNWRGNYTISYVLTRLNAKCNNYPAIIITFIFGCLIGHWFL